MQARQVLCAAGRAATQLLPVGLEALRASYVMSVKCTLCVLGQGGLCTGRNAASGGSRGVGFRLPGALAPRPCLSGLGLLSYRAGSSDPSPGRRDTGVQARTHGTLLLPALFLASARAGC